MKQCDLCNSLCVRAENGHATHKDKTIKRTQAALIIFQETAACICFVCIRHTARNIPIQLRAGGLDRLPRNRRHIWRETQRVVFAAVHVGVLHVYHRC